MENYKYRCHYCQKKYVPTRRYVQKYCSSSCRVKAHYHRNKETTTAIAPKNNKPAKVDKMSLAGVGNAAVGNLTADLIKTILTRDEHKPATRADIRSLSEKIKRFHRIKNLAPRHDGGIPYFDMETKKLVYFKN